jgi:hypothetical protein
VKNDSRNDPEDQNPGHSQAQIVGVRVAAAHDGDAELMVMVGFGNGGTSEIALDQFASASLMEKCGAESLSELEGHSWEKVREALLVSYNRFQ